MQRSCRFHWRWQHCCHCFSRYILPKKKHQKLRWVFLCRRRSALFFQQKWKVLLQISSPWIRENRCRFLFLRQRQHHPFSVSWKHCFALCFGRVLHRPSGGIPPGYCYWHRRSDYRWRHCRQSAHQYCCNRSNCWNHLRQDATQKELYPCSCRWTDRHRACLPVHFVRQCICHSELPQNADDSYRHLGRDTEGSPYLAESDRFP